MDWNENRLDVGNGSQNCRIIDPNHNHLFFVLLN